AVPDVLAPGLRAVFCGINPGRVSAAAAAHFANPRNDFWRLLHAAGFTPRLLEPSEQFELPAYGYGLTNAAYRTTPGSGDLRRGERQRFVIGVRRSRPNAFGRRRTPGGACRRLYSARSIIATARSTTSGSNPSTDSSSRDRSSSTYASNTLSSAG